MVYFDRWFEHVILSLVGKLFYGEAIHIALGHSTEWLWSSFYNRRGWHQYTGIRARGSTLMTCLDWLLCLLSFSNPPWASLVPLSELPMLTNVSLVALRTCKLFGRPGLWKYMQSGFDSEYLEEIYLTVYLVRVTVLTALPIWLRA